LLDPRDEQRSLTGGQTAVIGETAIPRVTNARVHASPRLTTSAIEVAHRRAWSLGPQWERCDLARRWQGTQRALRMGAMSEEYVTGLTPNEDQTRQLSPHPQVPAEHARPERPTGGARFSMGPSVRWDSPRPASSRARPRDRQHGFDRVDEIVLLGEIAARAQAILVVRSPPGTEAGRERPMTSASQVRSASIRSATDSRRLQDRKIRPRFPGVGGDIVDRLAELELIARKSTFRAL